MSLLRLRATTINTETTEQNHCTPSDDSYIKDKLEKLDYKIESIYNSTQGKLNKQHQKNHDNTIINKL